MPEKRLPSGQAGEKWLFLPNESVSTRLVNGTYTRFNGKGGNKQLPNHLGFVTAHLAQLVKKLSTLQEAQVQSLGGEDSLEKEMATHSSILT